MAVLSLPLSFNNSFWTQDYRRGLEVLYKKLEQVSTKCSCVSQFGGLIEILVRGSLKMTKSLPSSGYAFTLSFMSTSAHDDCTRPARQPKHISVPP